MKRHFLALDLKGNPALIAEYVRWHHDNLPEIRQSFLGAGVIIMDMNQFGNRLFTIMETDEPFSSKSAGMEAIDVEAPARDSGC